MALDKTAIDDVTFSISGAIDAVEAAIDRIEDCGLEDYERGKTKECLRKGMRLLEIACDIVDCAELIRAANEEWDELIAERERANAHIRKLESIKQQEVLTRRFIYNEKWEVIAVKMNITWQSVWKLYYRALKSFQKIF